MTSMAIAVPGVGELSGLGTALCWVGTSFCFAAASRRLGAGTVNLTRSVLAIGPLLLLNLLLLGTPWPEASPETLLWLAASGVVGLAIGDQFLFAALVDIGPRLSVLLMTLAPVFAAGLGFAMLGETLGLLEGLGIAVTLGGIAWVVAERPRPGDAEAHRHAPGIRVRGIAFGVLGAASQGIGVVLAKQGMIGGSAEVDPLAAQLVRMCAGAGSLALAWSILGRRRWLVGSREAGGPARLDRVAATGLVVGTLIGPVLGVWLSLVSVRHLEAGVASTLMAMSPVLVLPFSAWVDHERIGWRAGLGAAIAVFGVAILAFGGEGGDREAAVPPAAEEVGDGF